MSYTILNISDSDKHFSSAIDEYRKRLGKSVKIENIKPTKYGTPSQIVSKDTEKTISILQKKYSQHKKILLSKDGKTLDTFELKDLSGIGGHIVFIIGGPYGLDEELLTKNIDHKISFGKITFPHGLAKLTLLEQIYRIETIKIGKKYHY